jgi:hypothetical protein
MKGLTILGVWAACAALTMGCNGKRSAVDTSSGTATAAQSVKTAAGERPAPVDVNGCLTASGDRFVLTALQNAAASQSAQNPGENPAGAAAVPTTEAYQLIASNTDDLRKYVGQQVHVTGEADPARVAQVRELTPATPAGTSGTQSNDSPTVRTEESTRIEMRQLRVSSVTAAGGACPSTAAPAR